MTWLKDNWQLAAVNVVSLAIVASLLEQLENMKNTSVGFDPMMESGKWGVRFLLLCLAMTPLNTLFGWRSAVKLRKTLGLWAFGFGLLHLAFYVSENGFGWMQPPIPTHVVLGIVTLGILTAMAVTSNRRAMKRLGRWWKRLHRLVYVTGCGVIVHGMLAAIGSKKMAVRDPHAIHELQLYLGVVVVLLVIRIPLVRSVIADFRHRRMAAVLKREVQPVMGYAALTDGPDEPMSLPLETEEEPEVEVTAG